MTTSVSREPGTEGLILQEESLDRDIITLALPAVGESLLVMMVFFVNTLLIGWLKDPDALAAVSLGGLLINIANSLFSALAVAATSIVAHACGSKEYERARKAGAQAILLAFIVAGVLVAALWPSAELFLRIMGGNEAIIDMGSSYLRIILSTSFFGFCLMVFNGIMRGSGDTRKPMYITLAMNIWNVIAAYVLIFGVGSFEGLGVLGAGIATASARLVGSVLALHALLGGKSLIKIALKDVFRWDGHLTRKILTLSLPAAGEAVVTRAGSTLFLRIISSLGAVSLAAHQIALSVESLSFMPGWGLATAAATLTGQCLGARKPDLAEKAIRRTMRLSLIIMCTIGIAFALWGQQIVTVFGSTPEVLSLAGTAVRIAALEQASIAIVMVLNGTLRGAGDTRTPMLVTAFGVLLFRVAVVYLFAIVFGWGLAGVWLGTAVDWAGRAALVYVLFRRGKWKELAV